MVEIVLNDGPENPYVNPEIFMHNPVPKTDYSSPFNFRVILLNLFGNTIGSLSNNFKISNNRIYPHFVIFECDPIHTFRIPFYFCDTFKDILS